MANIRTFVGTISGITNPTFSGDKFGTCLENGTARKPTEYVAVE